MEDEKIVTKQDMRELIKIVREVREEMEKTICFLELKDRNNKFIKPNLAKKEAS